MTTSPAKRGRLLLVGWDAADWGLLHPLIDAGQMPVLGRLVEGGASGRLLCVEPPIGAAQWTSIATGKRPWQHGVCHSREVGADGRSAVPATVAARRSLTLWEMLAREGRRSIVVGWPAAHGGRVDLALLVSDRYPEPTVGPGIKPWPPPPQGTYWPAELGARLDRLRMSPEDVQADVISLYIPQWQKIDQRRDHRLGQLRVLLAADYSCHAATTELMRREAWDFAVVRFPALGQIARVFMPYLPPRRQRVTEAEFELYQGVMSAECRMLDLMLRRLINVAGTQTAVIVVSGHGARGYEISPAGHPAEDDESWKSPYGIFAAGGPGFAPDALLHGATVLDVAPTVLTWFGLPIGDDMEGRVLLESFAAPPEIKRVASWEPCRDVAPVAAHEHVHQPDDGVRGALRREADWNYIRSCLEAAQFTKAMPVLERLFREFPERPELGQTLFQCQLELDRVSEARQTLEILVETIPPGPASLLAQAELAWAERDLSRARSFVDEARKLPPRHPAELRRIGLLLLRLRQWDSLAELARQALTLDEQDPVAWLGLAAALLRKGQAPEAAQAAQRAIALKYFLPEAHFILVRALVAQGRWPEAREAMEALLKIQPDNRVAATYSRRIQQSGNPPAPT